MTTQTEMRNPCLDLPAPRRYVNIMSSIFDRGTPFGDYSEGLTVMHTTSFIGDQMNQSGTKEHYTASIVSRASALPEAFAHRTVVSAVCDVHSQADLDAFMGKIVSLARLRTDEFIRTKKCMFMVGIQIFSDRRDEFMQNPIVDITVMNGEEFSASNFLF